MFFILRKINLKWGNTLLRTKIVVDSPMRFTEEQINLLVSKITSETKVIILGKEEKTLKLK